MGGQVSPTSSEVIGDNFRSGRIEVILELFNLGHPMITDIAT